jgi:L-amino acid N-acyltransferase YncA
MNDLKFIPVKESDFGIIKEIYDYYILNSYATFHTEPISISELKEFIFINHPIYQSFIINKNNTLAGYCYLTVYKKRQAYNRTAEITLYLKPEFCNKGIGKIALSYLENIAKQKPIKVLIGIISGINTGSIKLFEKSGYTKCAHFSEVGEKFGQILDVVAYQKKI